MKISPTKTKTAIFAVALASSYFAVDKYVNDIKNAEKIKNELLEHPYKEIDEFTPMIRVKESEISEPLFNKTAYWKVEAVKIRKELDQKKNAYNSMKKHYPRVKSIYAMNVLSLIESNEIKDFLNNQAVEKQKKLQENPKLKLITTKVFQLDETFPTLDLYELENLIKQDSDWIPQKFTGYKTKKEKVKIGNKWKIRTVKDSTYKPAYKNTAAFFENTIKTNEKGKYLTCNYYAEIND